MGKSSGPVRALKTNIRKNIDSGRAVGKLESAFLIEVERSNKVFRLGLAHGARLGYIVSIEYVCFSQCNG